MGILSDLGDEAAIAAAAESVAGRLDGARSCVLELTNSTDHALSVAAHDHSHGGFGEPPSFDVPPRMVDVFGSQSSGLFTGTEGTVNYEVADLLATSVHIRWKNPYVGLNRCFGAPQGPRAAAFELDGICGKGNDAHMTFELRQVQDVRLVRSPDYRWVRLEGYAYDPEVSEWRPPSGHHIRKLHSWWSPSRQDNWCTADPRHTRPLRDPISPDYRHHRLEGFILAPDEPPPEGTVPLHSWWSPGRGDNWATTDPRHTEPPRDRMDPDYTRYLHEGWLFSPDLEQPVHTVPVHSWYSPSRGDNFITTDPRYRPD